MAAASADFGTSIVVHCEQEALCCSIQESQGLSCSAGYFYSICNGLVH